MSKVFLGGTCNGSTWRDKIIPQLTVDYFNPVVKDWNEDCQAEEERQKELSCNTHLYIITSEMTGVFSIAEAVQSSNNTAITTVFTVLQEGFSESQLKSLKAVSDLVNRNGAYTFHSLIDTVNQLNHL